MKDYTRLLMSLLNGGAGAALGAAAWGVGLPPAHAGGIAVGVFLLGEVWAERYARADAVTRLERERAKLQAQADDLVAQLTDVKRQMAQMAQTFEVSAAQRDARLVKEMKVIEGLVGKLAAGVHRERDTADETGVNQKPLRAPSADEPKLAVPIPQEPLCELSEMELLEVIRSALEDNRIDLYLQPVVTLPQRKTSYYEGLARLRSLDGDVIEPEQFIGVAERAGLMPIVDNLLLFRCIQIVRRLLKRHTKRPVFCNMSGHSLSDPDFFPQFLEFISENKKLAESLIFEFSQDTLRSITPEGEEHLKSLQVLGFQFSLDRVTNFDLDFSWLRRHNFKFLKVGVSALAETADGAPPEIAVENLLLLLEQQGITPIAERIEDEEAILNVLDYNIPFGQGYLFGVPRPIKRGFLDEAAEETDAA